MKLKYVIIQNQFGVKIPLFGTTHDYHRDIAQGNRVLGAAYVEFVEGQPAKVYGSSEGFGTQATPEDELLINSRI